MARTYIPGNPKLVAARRARGWYSQEEFVAAFDAHARMLGVDVSVSTRQARRWESPDPPWPHPAARRVLTSLLGVPIDQLGFTPSQLEPTETTDSKDLEAMHRRTFLAATVAVAAPGVVDGDLVQALLPTAARSEPASTHDGPSLASRVTHARRLFCTCQYGELNAMLPTLIDDLRQAQSTGTSTTGDLAGLLAIAYQTAASLLLKLGDEGNAWLAAGRAIAAAETSGDPVVMASSIRVQVHALARARHGRAAVQLVRHTADQLAGAYDRRPPEHLAALGLLLLRGATAASAASDRDATASFLGEAREVARHVTVDRTDAWANFSELSVALHEVSADVALFDAGKALHAAVPLTRRNIPVPERRAALWVDSARAYAQHGRLEDAYRALRTAEECAPEDIQRRPAVHALAADLVARDRRGTLVELRSWCSELGVSL